MTTTKIYRRHPADVTADRLLSHYERYFDRFSSSEQDAIGIVRNALRNIAEDDEQQKISKGD